MAEASRIETFIGDPARQRRRRGNASALFPVFSTHASSPLHEGSIMEDLSPHVILSCSVVGLACSYSFLPILEEKFHV